jgi:N-acetylmuramoyl-L-alanine amidase
LSVPSRQTFLLAVCIGLALGWGAVQWLPHPLVFAQSPEGDRLSVYSAQSSYVVPIITDNGQQYVGLVDLLEPLGTVDARPDGKKYKLNFTAPGSHGVELQFHDGKDKGKVKGQNVKLPLNFVIQNGRGYIPLSAVNELLSRMLSAQIRYNPAARRLFIGSIEQHFTLDLRPGTPSKLFISFDSPVNPTIATEPGHIRFTFRREPVLAATDHASYNDSLITGANFSEHDGIGELDITGNAALIANFADGGKTIIVTAALAPPPPVVAQQPPVAPPASTEHPSTPPPPPTGPRFFVLIDPAHGGNEIGAAISPTLPEKDVVLALARRVQRELANRGISAGLLRNSDIAISLDQRAVSANAARPALYVSLHAANTGRGVHVFTSLTDAENYSSRDFLPWNQAQAAFLDPSAAVAGSVSAELEARKLPNSSMAAPLRPMNNIAAPAIAIEIAAPGDDVSEIAGSAYQEQVAQSIAAGIAAMRGKIAEVRP